MSTSTSQALPYLLGVLRLRHPRVRRSPWNPNDNIKPSAGSPPPSDSTPPWVLFHEIHVTRNSPPRIDHGTHPIEEDILSELDVTHSPACQIDFRFYQKTSTTSLAHMRVPLSHQRQALTLNSQPQMPAWTANEIGKNWGTRITDDKTLHIPLV